MIIEFALFMLFISLWVALYFQYIKNDMLTKAIASFSPIEIQIGKVPEFTQKQEDILASNKEAMDALIAYLEKKLVMASASLHDRSVTSDKIEFIRGQCDTYIIIRGQMKTLLARKTKNDN